MRRGLNLIWTLVSATVMIIALLAVISAFTGGSPFEFLEGIAGMGDEIPLEPGTGTEVYWNNLSVFIAEDTTISADKEQIALLTFSQPLRDNVLQGGFMPVEVAEGPSGVGIADGFEGSEFGLQPNELAFTLSGDLESGDTVTIEIVEPITSQDGAEVTEGTCTDEVQDATAGDDTEASTCGQSGGGSGDSGDDGSTGGSGDSGDGGSDGGTGSSGFSLEDAVYADRSSDIILEYSGAVDSGSVSADMFTVPREDVSVTGAEVGENLWEVAVSVDDPDDTLNPIAGETSITIQSSGAVQGTDGGSYEFDEVDADVGYTDIMDAGAFRSFITGDSSGSDWEDAYEDGSYFKLGTGYYDGGSGLIRIPTNRRIDVTTLSVDSVSTGAGDLDVESVSTYSDGDSDVIEISIDPPFTVDSDTFTVDISGVESSDGESLASSSAHVAVKTYPPIDPIRREVAAYPGMGLEQGPGDAFWSFSFEQTSDDRPGYAYQFDRSGTVTGQEDIYDDNPLLDEDGYTNSLGSIFRHDGAWHLYYTRITHGGDAQEDMVFRYDDSWNFQDDVGLALSDDPWVRDMAGESGDVWHLRSDGVVERYDALTDADPASTIDLELPYTLFDADAFAVNGSGIMVRAVREDGDDYRPVLSYFARDGSHRWTARPTGEDEFGISLGDGTVWIFVLGEASDESALEEYDLSDMGD